MLTISYKRDDQEKKEKRVPLYKDKAAMAVLKSRFLDHHNRRIEKQLTNNQ